MSKSLVIVESPTKARTISRYLGEDITVLASMGHVRDLPTRSLGVDLQSSFNPEYVLTDNGKRVMKDLRKAAKSADHIYLATDPDREGEAIAWHLREVLEKETKGEFHRVSFHEITERAIKASFEEPGEIADDLVSAQQARRVLDRLIGYPVSAMVGRNVKRGASAGRVQSVALRLVVEREREISAFEPVEYWNLDALFETAAPAAKLQTRLALLDGAKPHVKNGDEANAYAAELESASYAVSKVESKPRKQKAPPPFTTSTLQQAAGSALRSGARQTMMMAQQLYEGLDVGEGGPVGLITYMRTDSVNVAKEAITQAREFIGTTYGGDFVPPKPNSYRSGKAAQEAHEAIRPTDVTRTPEKMAKYLDKRQLAIYRLIWRRFVASQMSPAKQMDHVIEIAAAGAALTHAYIFRATARETLFPGYQAVYDVKEADQADDGPTPQRLPNLQPGLDCTLLEFEKTQCFTKPPPRYSEATLIKVLEQNGVGRPSTYASMVNTIQTREYVTKDRGRLTPTELGFSVMDYLLEQMSDLFDVGFTGDMETKLDEVEAGQVEWHEMLAEFYNKIKEHIHLRDTVAIPDTESVRKLLAVFPDTVEWAPPVKRGRRTYDDSKFHASLLEQIDEKGKVLTERQWKALLLLAVRYAAQLPGLDAVATELEIREVIEEMTDVHEKQEKERQEAADSDPDPEMVALLGIFRDVEWAEPVKRGRRTYDDKAFHESLREQVESGRRLSPAQVNALGKLAAKYIAAIPGYEEHAKRFGLPAPEAPADPEEAAAKRAELERLFALADGVDTWADPVKRGRRTYDDREFVESLRGQFATKGSLSDRQIAALKKVLPKYADQIPEFERVAKEMGLGAAAGKPVTLDVPCPKCGAPLVERHGKRGKFYGCSAFPKCRNIVTELPS
ncbi:MAG: type I DNA topoisomerase [Lentisphaeria bacterium]|nr:type I DNA topoisomerase [Lentisphaeria bacterium]